MLKVAEVKSKSSLFVKKAVSKSVQILLGIVTPYFPRKKELRNQRMFLIGTEDWGNLGDHHIVASELDYLHRYFDEIVEVPASEYAAKRRWLKRHITCRDIIILSGGGNLGDVYPHAGYIRTDVIKNWPKNCKCVFPQTAYYTESEEGQRTLKRDIALMSSKNHVFIVAREEESYQFLKQNFDCDIFLTPDIVLSSKYRSSVTERKDIGLLCLRNDLEKKLTDEEHRELQELLSQYIGCVKFIDTEKSYRIDVRDRNAELADFIKMLQSARVMVTDRMHGMILCAITGTPCIAFENYNQKVRGTYRWISGLPYIKLAKNIDQAKIYLEDGFWKQEYEYNVDVMLPKYHVIFEEIQKRYYNEK